MLKQTFQYTDYDDTVVQETMFFNLTKTELTENLHLKEELEEMSSIIEGENHELTSAEIKKIVELVKTFIRLSYGVRSEDGKRFAKSPEIWTEFTQTAAYDGFLFSLFEDPKRAVAFMSGILPADIRGQVAEAADKHVLARKMQEVIREDEKSKPVTIVDSSVAEPAPVSVDNSSKLDKLSPAELEEAIKEYEERKKLL